MFDHNNIHDEDREEQSGNKARRMHAIKLFFQMNVYFAFLSTQFNNESILLFKRSVVCNTRGNSMKLNKCHINSNRDVIFSVIV